MIGVEPDSITHVLITHTHNDHYAGVTTQRDGRRVARFPHARHLVGHRDWKGNLERARLDSALALHLGTLDHLGLLEVVDGEHEVVSGVAMVAAPGETAGHCIVRVEGGTEACYIVGDLFHHACEVTHASFPGWGRIMEHGAGYRWEHG
jgi:glyoxylase-like metal-dependent hydrolase (beta-lactamase superfamily II)